jgi:hypothetical protein
MGKLSEKRLLWRSKGRGRVGDETEPSRVISWGGPCEGESPSLSSGRGRIGLEGPVPRILLMLMGWRRAAGLFGGEGLDRDSGEAGGMAWPSRGREKKKSGLSSSSSTSLGKAATSAKAGLTGTGEER